MSSMRFFNCSGVNFFGFGGLSCAHAVCAFVAAVFFVRDEEAFLVRDEVEVFAGRFLRVEV